MSAPTSDVMRAAEDPRPVLWTSAREQFVGANLGIWARDASAEGRFSAASCEGREEKVAGVTFSGEQGPKKARSS